jgi:hypothetical protein
MLEKLRHGGKHLYKVIEESLHAYRRYVPGKKMDKVRVPARCDSISFLMFFFISSFYLQTGGYTTTE